MPYTGTTGNGGSVFLNSSSITTNTAATNGTIWHTWTTRGWSSAITTSTAGSMWNTWVTAPVHPRAPAETDAQRALRESAAREAAAARQREAEARARIQREADDRAKRLLVRLLSASQRHEMEQGGSFTVTAPSGNRYRIDPGRAGNVYRLGVDGVWIEKLCIHQEAMVPVWDTMLMQKLLIETAEGAFRSVANITERSGHVVGGRGRLDAQVLDLAEARRQREAA